MEDVVDSLAGSFDAGDVLEVHLLEGDGVADAGEVVEVSRGEIVDAADFMALVHERMGQRRADKTCDSCDEITGHLSSPSVVYRGACKLCRTGPFLVLEFAGQKPER